MRCSRVVISFLLLKASQLVLLFSSQSPASCMSPVIAHVMSAHCRGLLACVLPRTVCQLEVELQRAKSTEAQLLEIAREEVRQRRRSEEEVARLNTKVTEGYSKIASVEAMAQQLQESMDLRTSTVFAVLPGRRSSPCVLRV